MPLDDFLFRGDLAGVDPDVAALVDFEAIRQVRKLIMIPSESSIPEAVREAVGSVLGNIYAEGYPPEEWRTMDEFDLLDMDVRLAEFRRKGSPRYYKGTEVAEIVESLARLRTAERFATDKYKAKDLFVNVQPLSGAPANSAVYTALVQPGDTIMGMNLLDGGHLTHGSPVNRSGLFFNIVSYGVRKDDEKLDYDQMRDLALKHRPKFIIAGFTSYPWSADWKLIRQIADEAGSLVLADVSHVAGLIVAGEYPSPVGIADVVSFTTHKTLHGPRAAILITHNRQIARKLDRAVFPGEQGGPHVNTIAGLAVAMKLAGTTQFRNLQKQIVVNARTMADRFQERGIRIPYGGTDTHMFLIDVGKITGQDGTPFSGDVAARILDIAGVVANRNTIPGDASPFKSTGVRFGTTWITQRGFRERECIQLTDAMADLLLSCQPFSYPKAGGKTDWRAKVNFETFVDVQQRIARLALSAGIDYPVPTLIDYPKEADAAEEHFRVLPDDDDYREEWQTLHIYGQSAERFLDTVLTSNPSGLGYSEWQPTFVMDANGVYLSRGVLEKLTDVVYLLHVEENVDLIAQWLTALSDGYVQFDPTDLHAKVPGPVSVSPLPDAPAIYRFNDIDFAADWLHAQIGIDPCKAYFVGCNASSYQGPTAPGLKAFSWQEPATSGEMLTTPLHLLHQQLGAKLAPFAGYEMPLWYASVTEEHRAVRTGAGMFDVTHMGVFEVAGTGAEAFLNVLTTNDVSALAPGESHYSYVLGTDGIPLDDIFVYRRGKNLFMLVVNASNNDKIWAWINAVKNGDVIIDAKRPWAKATGREQVTIRDLRAVSSGADRRVDIAVQGPESLKKLLGLHGSEEDKAKLKNLQWTELCEITLDGFDLIISRTGYTGERVAYEVFVHPDRAADFFKLLIGQGVTPCGLAARDSLRTEAGLPLYGHELAGDLNMNPADAGFGSYVKTWKPFFIGKRAFMDYEAKRDVDLVRFRVDSKGLRAPHPGDPIVDNRGRVIGQVTSCSVDSEGYQVGLALVKNKFSAEGASLLVYANAGDSKGNKTPGEAAIGDKVAVPQSASVISRFPARKKAAAGNPTPT